MSTKEGAGSWAPTNLRTANALDYGWWASAGPTGGYLVRRAIVRRGKNSLLRPFGVTTEFAAHRGENLIGELPGPPRLKPLVQ